MAITFAVDDVSTAGQSQLLVEARPFLEWATGGGEILACSRSQQRLVMVEPCNFLISAVDQAYAWHFPLKLTPDAIWITLIQGLARHVGLHAEELRSRFVSHEGKRELRVRQDDGDFHQALDKLRVQLGEHLKPTALLGGFSTTGTVESAATQVALMDCFSRYFEYVVLTMCGIPSITLEGTAQDWTLLRERAATFSDYGLDWWLEALMPVLEQLERAAHGRPDQGFFQRIYRRDACDSGHDTLDGWLHALFPYVNVGNGDFRNPFKGGLGLDHFPTSLSVAPFVWETERGHLDMDFLGGLLGVEQDPHELTVSPRIGWAVRARPGEMPEVDSFGMHVLPVHLRQLADELAAQGTVPWTPERAPLVALLGAETDGKTIRIHRNTRYRKRSFEQSLF